MITHIVLFKTKNDENLVNKLEQKFFELKTQIPEIKSINGGSNCSLEGFDKGFNKGYSLIFENKEHLQKYLVSKEHTDFVENYVKKAVDDVLVFDYVFESR